MLNNQKHISKISSPNFHLHFLYGTHSFTSLLFLLSLKDMSDFLWPTGLQHTKLLCLSLFPWVCSNSHLLSWWCYLITSFSAILFFCFQSFPASGSFPMSQLFPSGGHSIGASASASVLPMNIQGWFPLGLTGLVSFLPKRLLRVFSNTTVQKHQFCAHPSLWSNSQIHTRLLEKWQIWL